MYSDSPSIEIIELILTNNINRPLNNFYKPSINCLNLIKSEISSLLNKILEFDEFSKYHNFTNKIKHLVEQKINEIYLNTMNIIKDQILIQENYIWTDNIEFKKEIINFVSNRGTYTNKIINLLNIYYNTVSIELESSIPKIIMYYFIKQINEFFKNNIYSIIVRYNNDKNNLSLLDEDPTYKEEKLRINKIRNSLLESKKIIDSMKL